MKRSAQLAHIRQLCCLGLSGQTLMPALLRAIREYIDADSAGFFWVDAQGDMTNLYADRMLAPGLMRLYFERHYDGPEQPFKEAFLARADSAETVTSSSASADLMKSAYYNEILRHLDAHHVMYAVIRDQGHALGQLSLYRPKDARPFNPAERAAIKDISRYVAHAVNRPAEPAAAGQYVDSDDEGMVVVDRKGLIVQGAAASLNLLAMATVREFNQANASLMIGDIVPLAVKTLIDRVFLLMEGGAGPVPREHIDGAWGRFMISAYTLGDAGLSRKALVGVHVRRQEQMVVKLAAAMGALELPAQQREVALLLAQGRSNAEISAMLGVSDNTAIYHIRKLFRRLEAHDRAEAVTRIFSLASSRTG